MSRRLSWNRKYQRKAELMTAAGDVPVPDARSDHGPMEYLDQEHMIPISGKRPPERD